MPPRTVSAPALCDPGEVGAQIEICLSGSMHAGNEGGASSMLLCRRRTGMREITRSKTYDGRASGLLVHHTSMFVCRSGLRRPVWSR